MPCQVQSANPLICYNAKTMVLTNDNRLPKGQPQSAPCKDAVSCTIGYAWSCVHCMYLSHNYVVVTRAGLPVCYVIIFKHSCFPCSVSAKQAMLHRCLTIKACTTSVCIATLYLTRLPTSRLPAMRLSCCSLATDYLFTAYVCPAFCCLSASGLQGTINLGQFRDRPQCSNDDCVKPKLTAGY